MNDLQLRSVIYWHFVKTGLAPSRSELAERVGSQTDTDEQLHRLHDSHMIVLDDRPGRFGEIRMALPFAAEPTNYRVTTANGGWWANCAWDSLAICAAIQLDARIESTWADTSERLVIDVIDQQPETTVGFIHFQIPARHWWDDIVET